MRRLLALLAFLVLPLAGAHAQGDPPGVKGLFLLTDYPSQTVRAGEVTTIRVKVNNAGLAPSRWRSRYRVCRRAGKPTFWAAASRSPR